MIRCAALVGALALSPAGAQSLPAEVNLAIDRGIQVLLEKQRANGSFAITSKLDAGLRMNARYPMGVTALALYTLLKSGVPGDDPAIRRAVEFLRYRPLRKTYSVATLVLALDALGTADHAPWIRNAAAWLEKNVDREQKIWGYPEAHPDLSNTQFAVLALLVAQRHGYKVRQRTWQGLLGALITLQNRDGGVGYRWDFRRYSAGTMTTAAILTFAVGLEGLARGDLHATLRRRARRALARAWGWLERNFTTSGAPAWSNGRIRDRYPLFGTHHFFHYYYLYGLERAAATEGRERIAERDWYREGALELLRHEDPGGGWGSLVNTCFALLFLRRATFTTLPGRKLPPGRPRARWWRYTTSAPPAGWNGLGFNDDAWKLGAGAFGGGGAHSAPIRTPWKSPELWIRRAFSWSDRPAAELHLFAVHDDAAEFWINGVLAARRPQWTPELVELEISKEARAALRVGRNILAAHCRNTGGAQILDLRLEDCGARRAHKSGAGDRSQHRWWRLHPDPGAMFLRRWLVLGPIADRNGALLEESLLPDEDAAPSAGARRRGLTWREARSPGAFFDLDPLVRDRDHVLCYAFTWLLADREMEAVLWFGSDDGARVLLDGRVVFSHHADQGARADEFPIPLPLHAGANRLLIKVQDTTGATGFYARLTHTDASPAPEILPVLRKVAPNRERIALAQPERFSPAELLVELPLDRSPILDFSRRTDLERLAIGPVGPGAVRWLAHLDPGQRIPQPPPGGQGILGVQPARTDQPVRLYRKVRVGGMRKTLVLRVSPEGFLNPSRAACRLRIAAFDGELHALPYELIPGTPGPRGDAWKTLRMDLGAFVGREVLLIVEICAAGNPQPVRWAFLDDFSLR